MNQRKRLQGFTLLELIVVITIIGIMGTFVMINVGGMTDKAKDAKVKSDTKTIYEAAQAIETQIGRWPDSIDECVNAEDDDGNKVPLTLKKYPKDPWGNDYVYEMGEDGPIITCYGRDGSEGGSGPDKDVSYPAEEENY